MQIIKNANYAIFSIILMLMFTSVFDGLANPTGTYRKDSVLVSEIIIQGNKKTKAHIILREMTFKLGDYISANNSDSLVKINENHIFNLHLFLEVNIVGQRGANKNISFVIVVKERWYTIPSLIVELADRSLNEWWYLYDHDPKRVEYGLMLSQQNCRGRNESFTGVVQSGFSQQLFFSYQIPYFAKKQKAGLFLSAQYLRNREFTYGTSQANELLYLRQDNFIRNRMRFDVEFAYRNKIFNKHRFDISYNRDEVADTIVSLNHDYLEKDQNSQQYFAFTYTYESNKTDIHYYPKSGYQAYFELSKLGLGVFNEVNYLKFHAILAAYKPVAKKLFYAGQLSGEFSNGSNQAFLLAPNFGYHGIFVRSFEYYLIKGQAYFLNRNELKYQLFSTVLNWKSLSLPKFNRIPIDIYMKAFVDDGYVYDDGNFKNYNLQNKWLLSSGIGFDLVTYYDLVFRFEYGFNNLNEKAFFFHVRKSI